MPYSTPNKCKQLQKISLTFVLMLTWLLQTISSCTTSWCPFQHARWRGVQPSFRCWFGLDFMGTKTLMTPAWPFSAAQCRALEPLCDEKGIKE